MRILVTGGAGFIGAALCNALALDGHKVYSFDDYSRGQATRLAPQVNLVAGDIRLFGDIARACAGMDVVYHLAYVQGTQTFYEEPRKVAEVGLLGITNLLTALQPDQELILVSSSEVYQTPPEGMIPTPETVPLSVPDVTNPRYSYGGCKIASEVAALAYKDSLRRVVIARPHNIYGPDMGEEHVIPQLCRKIMRMTPGDHLQVQGTSDTTRSFCFIADCVRALQILLLRGQDGEIYHIGNPQEVRIITLAELLLKQLARPLDIQMTDPPPGSPERRCPDISKIASLGFTPLVGLTDGLIPTTSWYYSQEYREQAIAAYQGIGEERANVG